MCATLIEMKAITLRGIPPPLAKVIRQKAQAEGSSLNKVVIRLLEEQAFGKQKRAKLHHDLDALAGTWTRSEAKAFDKAIAEQRTIDPELWK